MRIVSIDIGIKNMAICIGTRDKIDTVFVQAIGSPKEPLRLLVPQLVKVLHEKASPEGLTHVLVEQQLGQESPKNLALAAAVSAYYYALMRERNWTFEVNYVNPKHKFVVLETTCKGSKQCKRASVQWAAALSEQIEGFAAYKEAIQGVKKVDDLADAFLMIITFGMEAGAYKAYRPELVLSYNRPVKNILRFD